MGIFVIGDGIRDQDGQPNRATAALVLSPLIVFKTWNTQDVM